ncbi:MAG: succinate dehydrogenase, hydrophobic membrane anchor protein [Alphaproteobacteria bacterium]|nr:succinate dehydrogenase, hydrophobic membrane anchor protein [Alphaproteobacteria bacterium]
MKYETPLHEAQSLGSAKTGVQHWMAQRVSAIALIPLGVWFIAFFTIFLTAPFEAAEQWLSSEWSVAFAILLTLCLFYHGYLGMRTIWEDYVPHESSRWSLIIATKLLCALMAIVAVVSILQVFLS